MRHYRVRPDSFLDMVICSGAVMLAFWALWQIIPGGM